MDYELIFCLLDHVGKPLDKVPLGLLDLGVAEELTLWVEDFSVFINRFLAGVLFAKSLTFSELRLLFMGYSFVGLSILI